MHEKFAIIARLAAARLKGLDERIPFFVDAHLSDEELPRKFDVATVVALASLIVSVSQLAWDIYSKTFGETSKEPSIESLRTKLSLAVALPVGVTPAQRDQVMSVVVEEIARISA